MKLISDSILRPDLYPKFEDRSRKAMIVYAKINGLVLSFDELFSTLVEMGALPNNFWGRIRLQLLIMRGMSLQDGSHFVFVESTGLFGHKKYSLIATFPGELE